MRPNSQAEGEHSAYVKGASFFNATSRTRAVVRWRGSDAGMDDPLCDGQAQAATFHVGVMRRIAPEEPAENAWQSLGGMFGPDRRTPWTVLRTVTVGARITPLWTATPKRANSKPSTIPRGRWIPGTR